MASSSSSPAGSSEARPMASLPLTDLGGEPAADGRLRLAARRFRAFMDALDLDPADPHLAGTELRVARAYRELFAGLAPGAEPELRTFPNTERSAEMVRVTEIPFHSLCAHHFLPFFGTAHVAYLPRERIVGLSKLARVVEYYARRPQVQERMTEQIVDLLEEVAPPGAAWSYNNAGFSIAGRIIEVTTGTPINRAMRDLIFQPLGLEHAGTTAGEFIVNRFA